MGFEYDVENYIAYAEGQLKPRETLLKLDPFVSHFVYNANCARLGHDCSAKRFINDLKEYIYDRLLVHEFDQMNKILAHYDSFFRFLNNKYFRSENIDDFELDVFTTNYDDVLEEYSEERGFDVFDGYSETPDGFSYFAPELYELHRIKLYKLHGSVRLGGLEDKNIRKTRIVHTKRRIRIGGFYKGRWRVTDRIMLLGYDKDASREPYFELLKILKNKLLETKTCLVVGYSFGTGHILNIYQDVLKNRGRDFKLIILARNAREIKKEKFSNDRRIRALPYSFSDFMRI